MDIQPLDQSAIEEITRRLVKTYDPREIYLLEPRSEDNDYSGILVVVNEVDIEHYDLMQKGDKALSNVTAPEILLVYTPEEFEEYSQDTATLSYLIKKYGKRIYAHA